MRKLNIKKWIPAFLMAFFIAFAVGALMTEPAAAEEEYATEPVYASPVEYLTMGASLGNSQMQLLDENGNVLEEWTSADGVAHQIETQLIIGKKYTLHQVTPPGVHESSFFGVTCTLEYGNGYDTEFSITKGNFSNNEREGVQYSYYEHLINKTEGRKVTGTSGSTVEVYCPVMQALEFGAEALGISADPDEYFEVILDIPKGVPGQVMNVDLSNADASKNPSKVVIPSSGSLEASFWLKDGQSITMDGFPLFYADYYSLRENNDTLNQEGYITKVLAGENIPDNDKSLYAAMLLMGGGIISKADPGVIYANNLRDFLLEKIAPEEVYAQDEIIDSAIEAMTGYASEELFQVSDPVVNTDVSNETIEYCGVESKNSFTLNDTLIDGIETTRSASKIGPFPNTTGALVATNGVFGDGHVLFINRRDGVPVAKKNEDGDLLAGSKLQILDSKGNEVHSFTSTDEIANLIELEPGEYTLHEESAPKGYLTADDVAFTVVDQETVKVDGQKVDAVTMIDKKDPNAGTDEDQPGDDNKDKDKGKDNDKSGKTSDKSSKTGDYISIGLLILLMALSGGAAFGLSRKRRKETSDK